jgi:hypothetical protein
MFERQLYDRSLRQDASLFNRAEGRRVYGNMKIREVDFQQMRCSRVYFARARALRRRLKSGWGSARRGRNVSFHGKHDHRCEPNAVDLWKLASRFPLLS